VLKPEYRNREKRGYFADAIKSMLCFQLTSSSSWYAKVALLEIFFYLLLNEKKQYENLKKLKIVKDYVS